MHSDDHMTVVSYEFIGKKGKKITTCLQLVSEESFGPLPTMKMDFNFMK